MCCFFFFKQKTAYEMRISDWSSDVCSSDLRAVTPNSDSRAARSFSMAAASPKPLIVTFAPSAANARAVASPMPLVDPVTSALLPFRNIGKLLGQSLVGSKRSEERRVGKDCVSTCRSRWWQYHKKKKTTKN